MLVINVACQQQEVADSEASKELFTLLSADKTGIAFRNDLPETQYMNGLFYEYYYNGAGVAAGDFNGDDLPDIYFVSNLQPNQLYLNQGDLTFKAAGAQANVGGKAGFPTGVTTVDINHDGRLDIYVCSSGKFRDPERRRNELYVNQGNAPDGTPHFAEQAAEYGLDLPELSTQAAFFDYDRDGDLDLFLINHDVDIYGEEKLEAYLNTKGPLSGERLYRNDNGKFQNVTAAAGIIDNRLSYGLGLAIGDVNNDGWPDVYVGHDFSGEDHLYINNGDGTFDERIKTSMRHISNFSMGNDMADLNNDGWLDIASVDMVSEDNYGIKTSMSGMNPEQFFRHTDWGLHHQYMFNTVQLNNGVASDGTGPYFSDIAQLAGLSSTDWSWSPLFLDMDLDGDKDLFVGNGIKRDFRNNDFVNYHKSLRAELTKTGTIDEKAYVAEVLARMPERKKANYFFQNNGDLTFTKLTGSWTQPLTCSNGTAYADFDNDGDLDLVVNNMDDFAFVYRNNSIEAKSGQFLKVAFEGSPKNPLGIGARVTVSDGISTQTLEHQLTRGFQSSVAPGLHFGLAHEATVVQVQVIWPDGKTQQLSAVPLNDQLTLSYRDAQQADQALVQQRGPHLFQKLDLTNRGLDFRHQENPFNDFARESLLPHRMSQFGPALAVGDVNGDGTEDIYIGGAMTFSGALWLQNSDGQFTRTATQIFERYRSYEDVAATFFDADGDGDLDLYIVSGGNERTDQAGHYQDRLYENDAGTLRASTAALPVIPISGSCVKPFDYDGDGDLDLFVGGRQVPGQYPYPTSSMLLRNDSQAGLIRFSDVTEAIGADLLQLGMVTDAVWADIAGDQQAELILVGEWMAPTVFQYHDGKFVDITEVTGLAEATGWWFSIAAADMDRDGDVDLIGGNVGLNYKYQASTEEPFEIYANDFDDNGNVDIVLGYYNQGALYPLRGRECSSNQMPFIKEKYPTYAAFGSATLTEVYEPEKLKQSIHYRANTFGTTYFENQGNGPFTSILLDNYAQLSSTNAIIVKDLNRDGHLDLLLAGNLYSSEVETPRNDASYGAFLAGDGTGKFSVKTPHESGLFLQGDVKHAAAVRLADGRLGLFFVANDAAPQLVRVMAPES